MVYTNLKFDFNAGSSHCL